MRVCVLAKHSEYLFCAWRVFGKFHIKLILIRKYKLSILSINIEFARLIFSFILSINEKLILRKFFCIYYISEFNEIIFLLSNK